VDKYLSWECLYLKLKLLFLNLVGNEEWERGGEEGEGLLLRYTSLYVKFLNPKLSASFAR